MKSYFLRSLTASTALLLGICTSVSAAQYGSLDTAASKITFDYSQMGVSMQGSFNQLEVKDFSFDTDKPETAQVHIEIPLDTINAGYADANQELTKTEWLNMASYPFASFKSNRLESLGDQKYRVTGILSIKGQDKEVSSPFTLSKDGDNGIFAGDFTFQRNDFAIGEGSWSDTSIVADDIKINFYFVAKP